MPSNNSKIHPHKKFWVIVAIVLAFIAGFLVARVRYKPQIQASFKMVIDREDEISNLRQQVQQIEDKMMMMMESKQIKK